MKTVIILSGPDRVGKSTFADKLASTLNCSVKHHSRPKLETKEEGGIMRGYRDSVMKFAFSKEDYTIWDRAYPCTYILEDIRHNTLTPHLETLELELLFMQLEIQVLHIGVLGEWFLSSPHHYQEVKMMDMENRGVVAELEKRRIEHHEYGARLLDFYGYVTSFPSLLVPSFPEYEHLDSVLSKLNL